MEGWSEISRLSHASSVSALEFDTQNELIWLGGGDGYINSYSPYEYQYNLQLYPYTKFRSSINDSVNQIISKNHLYSLSSSNINVNNKRGMPLHNINERLNPYYNKFNCMTVNELNNELIISKQDSLFKINLNRSDSYSELDFKSNLSFLNHQSKFLTLGKLDGSVSLFDQNSNKVIKDFQGHSNGLSDLDVQGNYLVTSGYSIRHNNFFVDPLINLYDLRMMKLLSPIPFPFGPSFVKFHPKLPNYIVIASKNGNIQFLDMFDQSNFQLYQIDLLSSSNYLNDLKFSSNGEMLGFTDNFNNLILWGFNNSTKMNNFSIDLDPLPAIETDNHEKLPVDDDNIPLNVVGMPYYKDLLLSNYGSNLIFTKELAKLPLKYDNENLPFLKFIDNKFDNNFHKYYPLKVDQNLIPFISDNSSKFDDRFFRIPNCYNKLLIKYSKFGIEDFNFNLFNKTKFSGLENNLDNSYVNSILQLYKYQSDFQNIILRNLFNEWLPNDEITINKQGNFKGSSLLNEMGYLFDMLNKTNGKNSIITNFSEFLNTIAPPELLNFDDLKTVNSENLKLKTLGFNQWMLNKLIEDFQIQGTFNNDISSLFLIKTNRNILTSINLFPINVQGNITNYLNYSLSGIIELPKMLSINVNFSNKDLKSLDSNWLLPELFTASNNGIIGFTNYSDNKYELLGYVAEINNGPETSIGNHNLITFVKIEGKWYLFNDFLVMEIHEDEVFNFKKDNKRPLILLYQHSQPPPMLKITNNEDINDSILYKDHFALNIREDYIKQYKLLTKEDPPQPGSLIAIDAEFVMLQKELFEINFQGIKNLIKPKKSSLARISVIKDDETPFIDDYIIHSQKIEDYITSFSGIEPGDLDPVNSTKNLVTFQTSYRRLWLLLNIGCVFIGHGLDNDFRTINLHVPPNQIRDTSLLFFLSDYKRKLSLKFLTFVVLNERVQVGNHDSIEDAKYALKLYKAYLELEKNGMLQSTLDYVYYEGQRLKFRVPE
ncbi:PAN2-PAN3 deadenylation complex catalytic subunit Pan2p [[Candida] jaroonii]|uniref:PAN2-PAN3 deadenylation complex catalytic subunit Pan2p n=1 Tax=[Candida] jaroonii TaxID=467808 RepID=A0ACA9YCI2_9ASCO|nr:PAN2-PAN3 deadenylation complex catalytic subunit Pan2p [[Candida] jaroonii]